jgi:hypothetical protein
MSLSIQYESVNDANMRLGNTIVLYDGKPVYIREVGALGEGEGANGDIYRVYIKNLPISPTDRGAYERKFISSKKFDLAPFPMGFMNLNEHAVYLSRAPKKQQKQGLSEGTLSAVTVGDPLGQQRIRFADLLNKKEFADCISGNYPNVREATRLIEAGAQSVAFSRCFAMARDTALPELIYLYHKKDKVGFIMDGAFKLSAKGRCLRESLQEVGVRC